MSSKTSRKSVLPREGLYIDPIASTIFDPYITSIFVIALTAWNMHLPKLDDYFYLFCILPLIGILFLANSTLTRKVKNNFTTDDTWDWSKELVLITGAASDGGIGSSVIKHLLERNVKIVVVDIAPMGYDVPKELVHYYQCDLSNSKAIKDVCDRVRSEVGHPTVLIDNAGLARGMNVADGTFADKELSIKVMLLAPFFLIQEFSKNMIEQNHGHIVSLSSMSAFIPPPCIADYAASKAGVIALHEALSLELKHVAPKIRLSLIIPSFIRTPLLRGVPLKQSPIEKFLLPTLHVDAVGEAITDILYSGMGRDLYLPGIMRYLAANRVAPGWFQAALRSSTEKLLTDMYRGRGKS